MQAGGFLLACVGLLGQFLHLNQTAQNNLTTICLAASGFIFANDLGTKSVRARIAPLLIDANKNNIPDALEKPAILAAVLGWSLALALLIALVLVLTL